MVKKLTFSVLVCGVVLSMSGCTSSSDTKIANLEKKLVQKNKELSQNNNEIVAQKKVIATLQAKKKAQIEDPNATDYTTYNKRAFTGKITEDKALGHLPKAAPGQAFARVLVPAEYKWQTRKIPKYEKSVKYKIIPATYKFEEQKQKVSEDSFKLISVPTTYKWEKDKIMVEPEKIKLIKVPAKYKMVTKKILIKEARDIWKQGSNPVEKLDNSTGEIVCKVHIPAVYKTITEKVVLEKAHTKKIVIPARYKYIKRKVTDVAAHTKKVAIPAKYEMVKVKKLVKPTEKIKIDIPEEFQTIREKVLVKHAHLAWKQVLYKGLTSPDTIKIMQKDLKKRGYNPGKIDGVYGIDTKTAVLKYEKDNNLTSGSFAEKTLRQDGMLPNYEKQQAENKLKLGMVSNVKEIK